MSLQYNPDQHPNNNTIKVYCKRTDRWEEVCVCGGGGGRGVVGMKAEVATARVFVKWNLA